MSYLLRIAQLGNPILRARAEELGKEELRNPSIQELIENMFVTCRYENGMGLAAPQVYQPLRIFVMMSKPNSRYPNAPTMEPLAVINPSFVGPLGPVELGWEGCLSIPGIRAKVPRNTSVKARFIDQHGQDQERVFEGFLARVFLHEWDHINGTLFIDHVPSTDLYMESEYQEMIRMEAEAVQS